MPITGDTGYIETYATEVFLAHTGALQVRLLLLLLLLRS